MKFAPSRNLLIHVVTVRKTRVFPLASFRLENMKSSLILKVRYALRDLVEEAMKVRDKPEFELVIGQSSRRVDEFDQPLLLLSLDDVVKALIVDTPRIQNPSSNLEPVRGYELFSSWMNTFLQSGAARAYSEENPVYVVIEQCKSPS